MNSATDNPLVFLDTGEVVAGGNFHGEYPAKVGQFFFSFSYYEI
jgi:histidine ammonia-lyase